MLPESLGRHPVPPASLEVPSRGADKRPGHFPTSPPRVGRGCCIDAARAWETRRPIRSFLIARELSFAFPGPCKHFCLLTLPSLSARAGRL